MTTVKFSVKNDKVKKIVFIIFVDWLENRERLCMF